MADSCTYFDNERECYEERPRQIIVILGVMTFFGNKYILLFHNFIMNTSSRHKITTNLAHARPRTNPTNTHTRIFIFSSTQAPIYNPKCTPTFHSNIFNRYNNQQEGSQGNEKSNINRTVVYSNTTKSVRQASLKHGVNKIATLGKGIEEFQDREKETLLKKLRLSNRYDRIRKNADLSSSPIVDLGQKQVPPVNFSREIALPAH